MATQTLKNIIPGMKIELKGHGRNKDRYEINILKKPPTGIRIGTNVAKGALGGALANAATAVLAKKLTGRAWISPKDAAILGAVSGGIGGMSKASSASTRTVGEAYKRLVITRNIMVGGGAALGGVLGYNSKYDSKTGRKIRNRSTKFKTRRALIGAGIGAGIGYSFDPTLGKRQAARAGVKGGVSGHDWKDFWSQMKRGRGYRGPTPGNEKAWNKARDWKFGSTSKKGKLPDWLSGISSKAEAKSKYRRMARKHHPDLGGSEEVMKKITLEWDSFIKGGGFDKLSSISLMAFWRELTK